jgi:hypothetical protein
MHAARSKYFVRRVHDTLPGRLRWALLRLRDRWRFSAHHTVDLRGACSDPLDAYYHAGNRPAIIDVPLAHCRWAGGNALAYTQASGHPYVRTLIEYDAGHRTFDGSYLQAYWGIWQPSTLAASLDIQDSCHPLLVATPPIHDIVPWAPARMLAYVEGQAWKNHKSYRALHDVGSPPAASCGPKPTQYGAARFAHLTSLYQRIKKQGYRVHAPRWWPYFDQHAVGQVLVRDRSWRVRLMNGQHRAAVQCVLGGRTLPVIVHAQHHRGPAIVSRDDADRWPLVRAGVFSPQQALKVFDATFDAPVPATIAALQTRRSTQALWPAEQSAA